MELSILPMIKFLELSPTYGKFEIEPLERGYGTTLGNALRRTLLSSIGGAAITAVKIDGILHEYSTLPNVKEDVLDILLNLKEVAFKIRDGYEGTTTFNARLEREGVGEVTAADIELPPGLEAANPSAHIATLTTDSAKLSMELIITSGKGYLPAEEYIKEAELPVNFIAIDAIFTPVKRVNFIVEPTRVGAKTNYDRLILEVWTNGAIEPDSAVRQAANILIDHFRLFAELAEGVAIGIQPISQQQRLLLSKLIEELEISARAYNALKRAKIHFVKDLLKYTEAELSKISGLGPKSSKEIKEKLAEMGFSLRPEHMAKKERRGRKTIKAKDEA